MQKGHDAVVCVETVFGERDVCMLRIPIKGENSMMNPRIHKAPVGLWIHYRGAMTHKVNGITWKGGNQPTRANKHYLSTYKTLLTQDGCTQITGCNIQNYTYSDHYINLKLIKNINLFSWNIFAQFSITVIANSPAKGIFNVQSM